MQPSALPDLAHTPGLAHTRARPVHWLATAAAMAGVIALAGLLQPRAATATGPGGAAPAPAPAPAPDARAVTYPLDCAGAPTAVARTATGDLDGDGRPETVAAAHCQAGSGTPPHGLYVLTRGRGDTAPRIVATLVEPAQGLTATGLALRDGTITATLLGYSAPDIPRCCPDRKETANWRWAGGTFLRTTTGTEGQ
ncbi:hypothetical protein [Streptomyces sp. CC228A]|uniref:hypothetical protein n=1 Tax=Streptomyces sp. CC228A TaxID=2898186 RepID=UPI001F34F3B2|nr:hypothetical protein [Streptomyces sp. CC228A]